MKVLLATVHSKYVHSSLALPYLAAFINNIPDINLEIREFTIHQKDEEIAAIIANYSPDVVAFSCYIWNIKRIVSITAEIKRERKNVFVIFGGPEVSYDSVALLNKNHFIDCIIKGEGEEIFAKIITCLSEKIETDLLYRYLEKIDGITFRESNSIIDNKNASMITDLDKIPSPFTSGFMDMNKPLIYYESSRGCPFSCAFCISSIDAGVRFFSNERVKNDLQQIINSSAVYIKFLDRTFNSNYKRAEYIWSYIIKNNVSSRYHFEIAADLLTEDNFEVLRKVDKSLFRFEIGVQSISENVLKSVERKSDIAKVISNVKRLLNETEVVVHLDLVAGLPYEKFDSIIDSLESLLSIRPHHIQVEILKVLKGTPMVEVARKSGYIYSDSPPYRIISTPWLSSGKIDDLELIGRLIDLVYNSERFKASIDVLAGIIPLSLFFLRFAIFWKKEGVTTLSLHNLFELFWQFVLSTFNSKDLSRLCDSMIFDYCLVDYPNRRDLPAFFVGNESDELFVKKNDLKIIREDLDLTLTTRVRGFCRKFQRDYRVTCTPNSEIYLLFVYLSSPGKKQDVRVMEKKYYSNMNTG